MALALTVVGTLALSIMVIGAGRMAYHMCRSELLFRAAKRAATPGFFNGAQWALERDAWREDDNVGKAYDIVMIGAGLLFITAVIGQLTGTLIAIPWTPR